MVTGDNPYRPGYLGHRNWYIGTEINKHKLTIKLTSIHKLSSRNLGDSVNVIMVVVIYFTSEFP